jgi:hypothetical protein
LACASPDQVLHRPRLLAPPTRRWTSRAKATVIACTFWLVGLGVAEASARSCPRFNAGPASFQEVRAAGVSCDRARLLLDRTTLAGVRRGRRSWAYATWDWTLAPRSETSALIRGRRRGGRRIRALFAIA